jgi:hypothetical protein
MADELKVSYQAVKKVVDGKSNAFTAANNDTASRFLGVNSRWLATGKGPVRPTDAASEKAIYNPADAAQPVRQLGEPQAVNIKPAFLHTDPWIAEAMRTLQDLPEQDRRAAVLNLRVFVATLNKPHDGQALPVAA